VINFERARLIHEGQESLAARIEHVSTAQGDGAGYDILSFERTGRERLIEVKTTNFGKETPFFLTRNELETSARHAAQYHLYRLFRFSAEPKLFTVPGNLYDRCALEPLQYRARVI